MPAFWTVRNLNDAGVDSLRWAIEQAHAHADTEHVVRFDFGLTGLISLRSALPLLVEKFEFQGNGANVLAVERNPAVAAKFRIFEVDLDKEVTIKDLTIRGGDVTAGGAIGNGGGIWNRGKLRLENCVVNDNTADEGGGIYNGANQSAELTLINTIVSVNVARRGGGGIANPWQGRVEVKGGSFISENVAGTAGGGIYNGQGSLIIENSTVELNNASGHGGGIFNAWGLYALRSTVSFNRADGTSDGGGLYNSGNAVLANSTVSTNWANEGAGVFTKANAITRLRGVTGAANDALDSGVFFGTGGGLYVEAQGTLELVNTIVASNTASAAPDVAGTVTSLGRNLVGIGTGSGGWVGTDQVGTNAMPIDARLSLLDYYGGPTATHLLLAGSPALDAGDNARAVGLTDQRGLARIVNGTVDIGAVEMQAGEIGAEFYQSLTALPVSKRRKR